MKVILIVADTAGKVLVSPMFNFSPMGGEDMSNSFLEMARSGEIQVRKTGGSVEDGHVDFEIAPEDLPTWMEHCVGSGFDVDPSAIEAMRGHVGNSAYKYVVRHQLR